MSAYVIQSDVENVMGADRLAACTSTPTSGGLADATVVAALITAACSAMDAAAQARPGVPVPLTRPWITFEVVFHMARKIAFLASSRRADWCDDAGRAPWWRQNDAADAWLLKIAQGTTPLLVPDAPADIMEALSDKPRGW